MAQLGQLKFLHQTKDSVVEIKDVDGPLDDFVDEKIDCLEASIDEESKMASNFKLKNYIATFGQILK